VIITASNVSVQKPLGFCEKHLRFKQEEKIMSNNGQLAERAMLVALHISAWQGMQVDREVTDATNADFKADKKAGRYNKRLVDAQFLEGISSASSKARAAHRLLTLPWEDDGTRVLANVGYINYTTVMKDCRYKYEQSVKEFLADMTPAINEAKVRLGDMFKADDYPDAADLKSKFGFDVEIKPMPEGKDFRTKLSEDAVKAIVKDIERRSDQRLELAMKDVFNRVHEAVLKMTERLREYQPGKDGKKATGIIRDTVVYNINDLADLMPTLNVMGDPRIDELASQLKAELVEHSPELLRSDAKLRQATISKADKILRKVKVYMK
jgi:hypothetical protein